jgi:hypothetical protein
MSGVGSPMSRRAQVDAVVVADEVERMSSARAIAAQPAASLRALRAP